MNILEAKTSVPIILVDGSYFVFHRFFATLKWYRFRDPNVSGATCMEIPEFREAVLKHAQADIAKLRKKWAIPQEGKKRVSKKDWENIPVWFATDCPRTDIWRLTLVSNYKGTRDGIRDDLDTSCFGAIYEVLKQTAMLPFLGINGLEADDIIALTHAKLRVNGHTGKIICITNDNDYLQLRDENTHIHNLDNKNLEIRSCGNPKKDLLVKILTGDKSDNIEPVRPKLTDKKLKELLHLTEEEIVQSLSLSETEQTRFQLNRNLIDFSCIPQELVERYNITYTIVIV